MNIDIKLVPQMSGLTEYWLPVVGYEGLYEVSNLGRVKSLNRERKGRGNKPVKIKGRTRKKHISNKGYELIRLCKEGVRVNKTVHRLVAQAFILNQNNLPIINHIDGVKTNNNISNLEWCNCIHNGKEAVRIGLIKSETNSKLTISQVREIKASKLSHKAIAKLYNVHPATISRIKSGKRWKNVA